jgi:hypothetical protein
MRVKPVSPALTEAISPYFRPIGYFLFANLGLAAPPGRLNEDKSVRIPDEHVEIVCLENRPDIVGIEVYVASAHRPKGYADYYRTRGVCVVPRELHVTSMPQEAAVDADTIVLGPAEEAGPRSRIAIRAKSPARKYRSKDTLSTGMPPIRTDATRRHLYFFHN